ncbi:queuosine precursor transporter [Lentisphaerota bacterium ZTH]|nr:queuosine precursor transporter [Lentisphaerota bacterium]WET06864.1 queuosine precursor transporter [Lentisphaerota bacterium ZTH]
MDASNTEKGISELEGIDQDTYSLEQHIARPQITQISCLLGVLLVMVLLVSNFAAIKLVEINVFNFGSITFPMGLLFFPLTYILSDIFTEVYGYKTARFMIWVGFSANIFFCLACWLTMLFPAYPLWFYSYEFNTTISFMPRIFLFSAISYFFGEFINAITLSRLKVIFKGRKMGLRFVISTFLGVLADSIMVGVGIWYGKLPFQSLLQLIFWLTFFKVAYEFISLPITYRIVHKLKRIENLDVVDHNERYNIFSIKL